MTRSFSAYLPTVANSPSLPVATVDEDDVVAEDEEASSVTALRVGAAIAMKLPSLS